MHAYPAIAHSVRLVIPQETAVCVKTMLELLLIVHATVVSTRLPAIHVLHVLLAVRLAAALMYAPHAMTLMK